MLCPEPIVGLDGVIGPADNAGLTIISLLILLVVGMPVLITVRLPPPALL